MKDKIRLAVKNLDYTLLAFLLLILCAGLMVLKSASVSAAVKNDTNYLLQQGLAALVGLILILGMQSIDISRLMNFEKLIYGLMNLMLLAVLLFGESAKGAQRYLDVGPIRIQPAEPAKIMLIFCLAKYLGGKNGQLKTWRQLIPALIYGAIPLGLIVIQPDLGTGLVIVAILFGMLLAGGGSLWKLLLMFGGGISGVVVWIYGHVNMGWWLPLEDYQLMRLLVFIDPEYDPRGWGWNLIQAQITVGSGGLWGQGWGRGAQTGSGYLPEQWTDFIFCVLGEEFGFVGCFVVLALFFALLMRCLVIAARAKNLFGGLVISGVVSMLLFHILQNVGMVVGIMPITGIPLPFISYGRSALLANMMAVGMVLNVGVYKDAALF
ncbi:MAG: rod shape-determining protein RodA [Clostridiales bacterium]|nr:rod shape-determining protein RodA [Clostridiales bacterium]